jgi:hypothetical protein
LKRLLALWYNVSIQDISERKISMPERIQGGGTSAYEAMEQGQKDLESAKQARVVIPAKKGLEEEFFSTLKSIISYKLGYNQSS